MKNSKDSFLYTILIVAFFLCNTRISFAQSLVSKDSTVTEKSVTFYKVIPSFDNWNTAELKATFHKDTGAILFHFDVPNYILRFKTTLNDYCIIETANKHIKLMNQQESFSKNGSLYYTLTLLISKDNLEELKQNDIKKITFYFERNENYIKKQLEEDKLMREELKQHFARLSNRTIKYKVSNPNEKHYNELKFWLQNI